ncbi:hypothetical protein VFPPC_17511 [Pochonia chlamydosporia 170]|uniref:Uncharacterized protein n=1 Tax=Pochonia chlamydosporia 170 TaxID=1380566 RepID=A0A219ARD2_METCM|nr:hypothetical protein VFPPC_17511 [Pochonia chlamydosporia 170]OWT43326.1 hypothetical protein VFPPC_17511 [Pochonia chlamydosporia 170]
MKSRAVRPRLLSRSSRDDQRFLSERGTLEVATYLQSTNRSWPTLGHWERGHVIATCSLHTGRNSEAVA